MGATRIVNPPNYQGARSPSIIGNCLTSSVTERRSFLLRRCSDQVVGEVDAGVRAAAPQVAFRRGGRSHRSPAGGAGVRAAAPHVADIPPLKEIPETLRRELRGVKGGSDGTRTRDLRRDRPAL
jgi:hypothetical protein